MDPADYPARAARQWIPPSIPPERLASGSRRVSRQSSWPVDPAQYPARAARAKKHLQRAIGRRCLPIAGPTRSSILPERLASGSRQVSYQSGSPVDSAEYPTTARRVARRWIPLSIPPEYFASGSRQVSHQSSPAEYPARAAASGSRRVSSGQYQAGAARQYSPVDSASIPPEQLASLVLLNVPPGAQLGFISCWHLCVLRVP